MMSSTGDVELRSVFKFCIGLGKSLVKTLKLSRRMSRSSKTMNPCSVSVIYKWHVRFRNGRKSTEDDSRDGWPCIAKMTIKDKVKDSDLTKAKIVSTFSDDWYADIYRK